MLSGNNIINQSLSESTVKGTTKKYGTLSVIMIGLGRIIACHCFLWNTGLGVGVMPFYFINIFWSIGVSCMSLCLAEMASHLPFTGGVYGFTRGLVGPFAGFLVGIFEFCGNVTLLGIFAIAFGQSVISSLGLHDIFILPFVIIPLGAAAILQHCGTEKFFFVVKLLTVISLVLFAIYVVGGLINISVPRYGNNPNARSPSDTYKLRQVFQNSNYGAAFFAGIETLPVVSSDARKPHVSIPWSLLVVNVFYCISFTAVIVIATWQFPGTQEVQRATLPLSFGYANIFGISDQTAAIFNAPAALTSIIVCTYNLCVTLRSMSQSGVLPAFLGKTSSESQVPRSALILVVAGTIIVAAMLLGGLLFYDAFALSVLIFGTYSLYFLYAAIFATYLVFYYNYKDKHQDRFQSPLGPWGAFIGLFMTCCLVVANNYPYHPYLRNTFVIFIGAVLIVSIAYIRVMVRHQRYSPEEEKIFFVAYIIRANRRHRDAIRKGSHHHFNAGHTRSPTNRFSPEMASPVSSTNIKHSISSIEANECNQATPLAVPAEELIELGQKVVKKDAKRGRINGNTWSLPFFGPITKVAASVAAENGEYSDAQSQQQLDRRTSVSTNGSNFSNCNSFSIRVHPITTAKFASPREFDGDSITTGVITSIPAAELEDGHTAKVHTITDKVLPFEALM
jgi:ethanolamine permease